MALVSSDNTISILFGVGDGTPKPQATVSTGKHTVAIAVADFDGDGNMDLATANQADNTISVLLSDGKGAFVSQTPVPTNDAPYYIESGYANNVSVRFSPCVLRLCE